MNITPIIQNLSSLLTGFSLLNYLVEKNKTKIDFNEWTQSCSSWIKNELIKYKVIENHISEILKFTENNINHLKKYDFSSENLLVQPIFQNIFKEKLDIDAKKWVFPKPVNYNKTLYYPLESLQPLSLPKYQETIDKNQLATHLKNLLKDFKNNLEILRECNDLEAFCFTFYYLFSGYASRISCFNKELEDVSLLDFFRVITAIQNCQAQSQHNQPLILIKGDLVGIQKFIYSDINLEKTGSAQGVAKELRGRSFYVSLLTDFLASIFIQEFQVFESNILYSGGGHFLVLVPNTEDANQKILKLERKINLMLSKKVGLKLSFILGKSEFDDSILQNASYAIQKVNHELNIAKYQKHLSFLEEVFSLQLSDSFNEEELGRLIPHSKFLMEMKLKQPSKIKSDFLACYFDEFSSYFFLPENLKDIFPVLDNYSNEIQYVKIYKLNSVDTKDLAQILKNYSFPIYFGYRIIANYIPKDKDKEPYNFEQISELAEDNEKLDFKQLGILRLDVDHLGTIFSYGLEKNQKTSLMRVASLSRELNNFFAGYSNTICEKHKIYTVYSGGDDAFFIGSWINILHFVRDFRNDFDKLVCYNPNLTFSAGIFMCHHKHPIAKFAEETAEMEKLSKKFHNGAKNALTVFDHTLSWNDYYTMLNFSEKLLKHIDINKEGNEKSKDKLARSFVHRILRMIKASLYTKGQNEGQVDMEKLLQNSVQLRYLLARRGFTNDEIQKKGKAIIEEVINVLLENFNKKEVIKNFLVPMHYVILKTRKVEKTKK